MKAEETQRKKATVRNTSEVYKGRIFNFVTEDLTLPNGRNTEIAFIRHPGSIAVVPLLEDHSVVMELQYRHPVGEYLLEITAGTMEPGESPLDCAQRELIEETGFQAQEFIKLAKIHIIQAYSDEEIHVFIAKGLTSAKQNLDPDEIIKLVGDTIYYLWWYIVTSEFRYVVNDDGEIYIGDETAEVLENLFFGRFEEIWCGNKRDFGTCFFGIFGKNNSLTSPYGSCSSYQDLIAIHFFLDELDEIYSLLLGQQGRFSCTCINHQP